MRRRTLLLVLLLLLGAPVRAEKPRLAVMELAAKSGIEQAQLDVLGDMLATEIRGIGLHEVITKSDIQSMIGLERSKELLSCDDASCMAEIGGALGVELMVTGNVGRFGEVFAVNLKLINVKQAKVENSVFRKVPGGERGLLDDFPIAVRILLGTGAAPPPSATPTALPPATAGDQAGALMGLGFTAEHIKAIHARGIRISGDTVQASRKLLKREYTTDELTRFIVELNMGDLKAREAEQFVLYMTAGLRQEQFGRFWTNIRKRDLTDHYNMTTESKALGALKWVCFGVGLGAGLLGIPFYTFADSATVTTPDGDRTIGISMMTIGSLLFVTSIALMILDGVNIGNLPDRFFDKASKKEILKAVNRKEALPGRGASLEQDGPALLAAPYVAPDGKSGGLMLGVRF